MTRSQTDRRAAVGRASPRGDAPRPLAGTLAPLRRARGAWLAGLCLAATVALAEEPAATVATTVIEPPPAPTIVTSERLNVDYLRNLGTFEGNVLVVDPRITVRADKMVVQFGAPPGATNDAGTAAGPVTNLTARSLQRIEASGAVVITQEDKQAESEHAVYTAADGKVVLTGHPRLTGPDGTVSGATITFWRDDKRVEIESGTRLVLFPDEPKKTPPAEPDGATDKAGNGESRE